MSARDEPSTEQTVAPGRSAVARYTFALAVSLSALLVNATLQETGAGDPLYAPLIGAVALAAWYGGIGPGIAAVAVCWPGMALLLTEPRGEPGMSDADWVQAAVGLAVALVVLGMSEVLRSGRRRALSVAVEAEASVRRLEPLNRVAAALTASASSADVARALTTLGAELVASDGATVALVEGDEVVLHEPSGIATQVPYAGGRLSLDRATLLTRAIREGVLVRAARREEIQASFPDTAATLPSVRSAVAAPLRAAGEVVGALGYVFERENALDDETTALVDTIAGLAEQALERAKLYERELEWRQSLDRILRVAPAFHAESRDEVLQAICREARTTFGADYGVLWRALDDELELLCIEPGQERLVPGSRFPLEDFPGLEDAVGAMQVSFVPDVLDEAGGAGLSLVKGLGIRSSLRTPVTVGGRVELVLVVSWQTVVSEPDPATVAIARRFADQAGLALEQLERRRAEADAARRAEETLRLQEITAALSLAATPLDVGDTCLEHALRSVGAEAGFVVLTGPEGTSVQMLTSRGLGDDELDAWSAFGLDADVPFARAIASGEPVWALGPEEMEVFTGATGFSDAGWVTLPLRTSAGVRGAVHLSFRQPKALSEGERAWLQNVVSQCAQALERSRLFADEQLLRSRSERAQSLTESLANALTRADVAGTVVQEVTDAVGADAAALGVVVEDRDTLRLLSWRGFADDELEAWAELPVERTPASRALRARAPVFVTSDELEADFPHLRGQRPFADHSSFLFVPLVAGRRPNGLLVLSWSQPQLLSPDEIRFVGSLAGQAAQALDRAAHFETEQRIAETLQRSVLPVSLPRVEGIQLAARYLPGTSELDVGGDWFDALQLADGRLGLVVGDVVGKGVNAAASMGQLRNALRAFSVERLKPSSALTRLNRLAEEVLETTFATLVYVVVDPATMVCRIACAGHPPPVLAAPSGKVELLEAGRGLPLGAGLDGRYRQEAVTVPDGSALVLYSDGLVERRGQSIDEGLDALCEAVGDAPPDADQLLEHVLERLVGAGERADDIALLAARLVPVAPRPLDLEIPSRPGSLDLVRYSLRTWLDGSPLSRSEAEEVLLATWEAAANAVEHAVEPSRDTVRVRASLTGRTVQVVVDDSGRWAPTAEAAGRGLGLRLMRSVSSGLDISTSETGTRVTLSKTGAGAGDASS